MLCDLLGFIGTNSESLNVIVGLLAALVTGVNAIAAYLLIKETRLQRQEQNRPDIIISLHEDNEKPHVKKLSIRNLGTRTGFNIRFSVNSSRSNFTGRPFSDLYIFKKGIANLSPSEQYTFLLAILSPASFEEDVKEPFIINVLYDDNRQKTYSATYSFDLRVFENLPRLKKG